MLSIVVRGNAKGAFHTQHSSTIVWSGTHVTRGIWAHSKYDHVIKWKHFPRNWSFVRGIHRSPVNSPHKGQWRGASMLSLICAWTYSWANKGDAGDLRRHCAHYDVTVMKILRHICIDVFTIRKIQSSDKFTRTRCKFVTCSDNLIFN